MRVIWWLFLPSAYLLLCVFVNWLLFRDWGDDDWNGPDDPYEDCQ